MAEIKYHYALDEHNIVVCIDDVVKKDRHLHTFRCVGCGNEMIAKMGKDRAKHFAHKGNGEGCGSETYLHFLAKRLLREKFLKEDSFEVGYYCDNHCSDSCTCKFYKVDECKERTLKMIDLKQYYDKCEEEQAIDGFIADLLLSNNAKPNREKVLIEIQVSHKSSQRKTDSGLKIIELYIKSEEDITRLLSSPIIEHPDAKYRTVKDVDTVGYGRFYGFKDKTNPKPMSKRSIQRFLLFPSGKAFVQYCGEGTSCQDVKRKRNSKALFEASIDVSPESISTYYYGFVLARQKGFKFNTCTLCKYHKWAGLCSEISFCCLYKKFGTPMEPEPIYARHCEYYSENQDLLNEVIKTMPPFTIAKSGLCHPIIQFDSDGEAL